MLEGPDLISSALDTGAEFEAIYVEESAVEKYRDLLARAETSGYRIFVVDDGIAAKVADATTPQPILAAVRFSSPTLAEVNFDGVVVVLHNLRDPGNVGTMIRSAAAFGARAVVLTGQGVDPYNAKTLRATAGAIFHVPVVVAPRLEEVVLHARAKGSRTCATVVRGGIYPEVATLSGPLTLVIGSEADGLSDEESALTDVQLTLSMSGATESLNAGVAAGILLYLAQEAQGHGPSGREP